MGLKILNMHLSARNPNRKNAHKGGSGPLMNDQYSYAIETSPHFVVYTQTNGINTQPKFTKGTMKNQIPETSETLMQKIFPSMSYLLLVSHANHSVSQGSEAVLKILEGLCSLKLLGSPNKSNHAFYFLKTLKGYYHTTKERRLLPSLTRWMNWGMTSNGKCLTAKISGFHKTENGCSLSDILEEQVDQKYFLSDKAMKSIQGRMHKGTTLHTPSPTLTSTEGVIME